MDSKGNIQEFNLSKEDERKQYEALQKDLVAKAEAGLRRESTPITSDQARFFKTKGMAFRGLWGKRLSKGLTPTQALELKEMIDEFVSKEQA